ncbi:helix-turn-helix transcriptional regulator [Wohlfahrtiimonas chitiniclastica]|uniref:helix-turn-helix transcriptional regulator n=1 Tax=Wohlfahrtiimonas chitiniclastica TaxID=400946 RepID=UPI00117F70E5|nr:AlpA family phage regulatory protein [Wohlfahrtiimonas chitiniclastica]
MENKMIEVNDDYVLWTRDEVKKILGLKSNSALYNAINQNGFPKPLRIGGQASRWRKSDVLKYIDNCPQELNNLVAK